MRKTIALLGSGWLGEPLAHRLLQFGYTVKVATTNKEKATRLRNLGWDTYLLELYPDHISGEVERFFAADQLVLTVPPGGRRNPGVVNTYPAKIQQALQAAQAGGIRQVLFTSSTGIYGNQQGIVTEDMSLQPVTASGKALVEVESLLKASYADQVTILRLAGLVGGDRQPGRWFAGKEEVPGGEQLVNLVHREDVLGAMERVLVDARWGHILNICADEHPMKAAFYPLASKAIGLVAPTFITNMEQPQGKIIDNTRGKAVLGFVYRHPNPLGFPFEERG
ncbi:NAD-dependent epimerase/dehydratase family protein [Lewinella cohaerens]|uniref:NAD-dependent epimerase/dehydratase family protein n=1 Tax=Lewinella cohaerens TaxID=70995 RepID=UPI0003731A03|nr:NAD-dependent epimerase/dehydratase family protein [Lewinella cohaerens]